MLTVLSRFERFNSLHIFTYFRYGWMVLLSGFVVVKLLALGSELTHQQQLLFQQSKLLHQQQVLLTTQLSRLDNTMVTVEEGVKTQATMNQAIKACHTELNRVQMALQRIQAQTENKALVAVFKHVYPTAINSRLPHSKCQSRPQKKASSAVVNHHLPFQIVNIDSWNGEPMVMVNHQDHVHLLSKADSLVDWTVVAIDFSGGRVTFKHRSGQLVRCVV